MPPLNWYRKGVTVSMGIGKTDHAGGEEEIEIYAKKISRRLNEQDCKYNRVERKIMRK
jgi:hypothetical protein